MEPACILEAHVVEMQRKKSHVTGQEQTMGLLTSYWL